MCNKAFEGPVDRVTDKMGGIIEDLRSPELVPALGLKESGGAGDRSAVRPGQPPGQRAERKADWG